MCSQYKLQLIMRGGEEEAAVELTAGIIQTVCAPASELFCAGTVYELYEAKLIKQGPTRHKQGPI